MSENTDLGIEPLADRLLLEKVNKPMVTSGGIISPDTNEDGPIWCKVMAVGPTVSDRLTVGSYVMIGEFAGVSASFPGEPERWIALEEEVIALLDSDRVESVLSEQKAALEKRA